MVHFVVDRVGRYAGDEADLLDGSCVARGKSADYVRARMEKTATKY